MHGKLKLLFFQLPLTDVSSAVMNNDLGQQFHSYLKLARNAVNETAIATFYNLTEKSLIFKMTCVSACLIFMC